MCLTSADRQVPAGIDELGIGYGSIIDGLRALSFFLPGGAVNGTAPLPGPRRAVPSRQWLRSLRCF